MNIKNVVKEVLKTTAYALVGIALLQLIPGVGEMLQKYVLNPKVGTK